MGAILASLRQRAGLDQAAIAQRLGITQASWSRVEGGKAIVNLGQLEASCSAMKTNLVFIAQAYEHVCELLERNGITVIIVGLKASTPNINERMCLEIKNLIATHLLEFSKNYTDQ